MTSRVTVDVRMLGASGIGTYLRNILPKLTATGGLHFELLGSPADLALAGLEPGPTITFRPAEAPVYSAREQLELPRLISRETDLVWSPHYNIPLLSRARLMVTVHDVLHLAHPEHVRGAHRRLYARAVFQVLRRRASRIICDSEFTADELVRLTGTRRELIRVIHLGVEPAWFEAAGGALPQPAPYLLFVGNVKPHKNLPALLDAFCALTGELPHDLVIVGKREGFITGDPRVEERSRGLLGRVRFTGPVDDETLRGYVAGADALVFPSLYEGFGLPPLEAMASGCPVISSRAGSLPEVCGDAALYCDGRSPADIADKIRLLLGSSALREELVGRGRARARLFSWERCADQTREVILEALDTRAGAVLSR